MAPTPKSASKTAPPSPKTGVSLPLGNHPGNTGGKKGRSGRRPLAITQAAAAIFDKHRLLEVAAGIAVGRIEEEWYDDDGQVHSEPTKNSDRLAAIKFLAAYGFGSPTQVVEHTGEVLNVHEYRQAFESRMDRLTTRLGAAAFPEWPD